MSDKELVNAINLLRSRHVSWILLSNSVWEEDEWLDAHRFNAEVLKLVGSPRKVKVRVSQVQD